MSLEFAAHLATNELVSTHKELRNVEDRHEKLYTEHENLKEAMIEMEKKIRELEQTVSRQDEELARHQEAEKEWSISHILREIDDEWAKATPDTDKIKKLGIKYETAVKIEELKSLLLVDLREKEG
jgi:predicted RNase H-like nuclease (RuvC/YqgF family)